MTYESVDTSSLCSVLPKSQKYESLACAIHICGLVSKAARLGFIQAYLQLLCSIQATGIIDGIQIKVQLVESTYLQTSC